MMLRNCWQGKVELDDNPMDNTADILAGWSIKIVKE